MSWSASRPGKRCAYSALNSAISRDAICLNASLMLPSPSSCVESMRIDTARSRQPPPCSFENSASAPGTTTGSPFGCGFSHPAR